MTASRYPLRRSGSEKAKRFILANSVINDPAAARIYEAFTLALHERGYVEGHNLVVERRFAAGRDDRFGPLATELVGLNLDAIVTTTTPGAEALKAATSGTPIVLAGGDPGNNPRASRRAGSESHANQFQPATGNC